MTKYIEEAFAKALGDGLPPVKELPKKNDEVEALNKINDSLQNLKNVSSKEDEKDEQVQP